MASEATSESRFASNEAVDASLAAASSPLARESVRDTRAPASNAAAFLVSTESEEKAALATDAATTTPLSSKAARARRREIFSRAMRSSTAAGGAGDAQPERLAGAGDVQPERLAGVDQPAERAEETACSKRSS